jgi:triphosphoribosyl-dephospho-CoA synthase
MSDPAHTIGYLAQVACTWEVLARKAGNVCPGREFPDLTVNDFLVSAAAIAPVLDQAPHQPLGMTILRCIEETRKVVNTNTNLGIVLLLAPLASVPLDEDLQAGLARVLSQTTVEDSRNVYKAIRLAKPGGLGDVKAQDVKDEPTLPLRDVMALTKERDLIASQYYDGFAFVERVQSILKTLWTFCVERAIIKAQLGVLVTVDDSLILRKAGFGEATAVRRRAEHVVDMGDLDTAEGRAAFLAFDAWLRSDNHVRNPGTTADLIAAALFVALREGRIDVNRPFVWEDHPFSEPEA